MEQEITVQSVVIAWPEQTITITDTAGLKRTIPLDTMITVTMVVEYPDRVTLTMPAHDLDPFMMNGYIIEAISIENE